MDIYRKPAGYWNNTSGSGNAFDRTDAAAVTKMVMEKLRILSEMPYGVPVGVSARHIHLSREDIELLFGRDYQLTPMSSLSQPGQYASKEQVEVTGPSGKPLRMRVLGPSRPHTQIEISLSDGRVLGEIPPVRCSGDTAGTPGVKIKGPKGEITVKEGLIIPDRHIHMTPGDAAWFKVENGQRVSVRLPGIRGGVMDNVVIRVTDTSRLDFHIDTDDANAFQLYQGQFVEVILK